MEALITTAWRAFWVGLGASAVLIAQTLAAPAAVSTPSGPPETPSPLARPAAHDTARESASLPALRQAPVGRIHNAS